MTFTFEGWKKVGGTDYYETSWAVCGKRSSGTVFVQTGKDIAKLDDKGKIVYLENIQDNTDMFKFYKKCKTFIFKKFFRIAIDLVKSNTFEITCLA